MKSELKQAVSLERILKYWDALKEDGVKDRVSIRVMEGMIYSLMDDEEFYEEQGCRRAINILTVDWDLLRGAALIDEDEKLNWGSRILKIDRTPEQEERFTIAIKQVDEALNRIVDNLFS